ncbi:C-type lectin 37Da-like [Diabrotica undecimpunctata]|uniref:C-type lectin 37Da-like n=1 Tax=Diabrotica undecimpunctata TaxID=50387 RepID=UPI003B63FFBC
MEKQIIMILLMLLFKLKVNSAGTINYAVTKDTGISQTIVPAIRLEKDGNTLYYLGYTFMGSWIQALEHCKALNMDLVSIETNQENEFLHNQMKELFGERYEYSFWTSGTTLPYSKWVWMGTGRPILYSNWLADQSSSTVKKDTCLGVVYNYNKGLQWNENNQNTNLHTICEAKITKSLVDIIPDLCNFKDFISILD